MQPDPAPVDEHEWLVRLQFLDEARTYLNTLETEVVGLGSQQLERPRLDRLLRAAHSIKGGAAMMGFPVLSDLAHRLEDGLKVLQAHPQKANPAVERTLLAALDCMRQIVQQHQQKQPLQEDWLSEKVEPIFQGLREQLGELRPEDTAQVLAAEAGGDIRALLFETEVEACLQRLEGVLAAPDQPCLREEFLIAAQELGALGEMLDLPAFVSLCGSVAQALEALPPTAKEEVLPIAQGSLQAWRRSQALVLVGQTDLLPQSWDSTMPQASAAAQASQTAGGALGVSSLSSLESTPELLLRVAARPLEQLGELFGDLTSERNRLNGCLQRLRELVKMLKQRVRTLEAANSHLRSSYDRLAAAGPTSLLLPEGDRGLTLADTFDLLEMDRYGELHLRAQEVMETVVQIDEVTADIDTTLQEAEGSVRQLSRLSRQMQTRLDQVRMQPLSELTDRFPRALRELSLAYGKPVELRVLGGSTLIERSILEALADPLLHLVRNAFDHGIEDPDTRLARGKPAKGLIEIAASQRGNRLLITVRDDGRGIPLDKVRARALQMGFSAADLEKAAQEELLELIFQPGFSTAEQVSELSGRGVGLDVVRTNLEQIGGQVQVESWPGEGTLFTLTLPFSLSVSRVLLTECQGLMLAFPANAVEEVLLAPEPPAEAFLWEGEQVPLIPVGRWFRFARWQPRRESDETPLLDRPVVLLVAANNRPYGLLMDRLWREQEVTLRPVEGGLPLPPGFSGGTVLADGRIALFVDPPALLGWLLAQRDQPCQPARDPLPQPRFAPQTNLLVVEDSVNVRRFLAMTLERAGFQVEQARDGQDALERLEKGVPIQAVITDIEMPRLDGFGLLARIRAHPLHSQLPVVILTSRSGEKHRQLAQRLGASAYFSKPFQEQELIQKLRDLLQPASTTAPGNTLVAK